MNKVLSIKNSLSIISLSVLIQTPLYGESLTMLKPCPDKPNCINSEYSEDKAHYIKPLVYSAESAADIMKLVKTTLIDMEGDIVEDQADYVHAVFTSKWLKFKDDVEIRNDQLSRTLHLRSASRTGYYDFGVNRQRLESFSQQLRTRLP